MELNYNENFHDDVSGPFDGPNVPVVVFQSTSGSGGVRGGFTDKFSGYLADNNIDADVRHDPRLVDAVRQFDMNIFDNESDTVDIDEINVETTTVGYTITMTCSEYTGECCEKLIPVHDYSIPVIRDVLSKNPDDTGPVANKLREYLDVVNKTTLQKYRTH